MNLTDQELEQLKEARQKDDDGKAWNSLVDEIKAKRNGEWPPDWYQKVIANPDIDTTITMIPLKRRG